MKRVRLTPLAEAALDEIQEYSIRAWGEWKADTYRQKLLERLKSLAAGAWPRSRSCAALFRGQPDEQAFSDLNYYREGSHYLIIRETTDELIVLDILHVHANLERVLPRLAMGDPGEDGQPV